MDGWRERVARARGVCCYSRGGRGQVGGLPTIDTPTPSKAVVGEGRAAVGTTVCPPRGRIPVGGFHCPVPLQLGVKTPQSFFVVVLCAMHKRAAVSRTVLYGILADELQYKYDVLQRAFFVGNHYCRAVKCGWLRMTVSE